MSWNKNSISEEIDLVKENIGLPNIKVINIFNPEYSKIIIFESKGKKYVLKKILNQEVYWEDIKGDKDKFYDRLFKKEYETLVKVDMILKYQFNVPKIVFISHKKRTYVTNFIEGVSLKELILNGHKIRNNLFYELGQKLNLFHNKVPSLVTGKDYDSGIINSLSLNRRLKNKMLKNHKTFSKDKISKTSYQDFTTWNILIDKKRKINFLDVPPGLEKRFIYEDLAFFIVSLYTIFMEKNPLKLIQRKNDLKEFTNSFLEGYFSNKPLEFEGKTLTHFLILRLLRSVYYQKKKKGLINKMKYIYIRLAFMSMVKRIAKKNGII